MTQKKRSTRTSRSLILPFTEQFWPRGVGEGVVRTNHSSKVQMPGGLPRGGLLKPQTDRRTQNQYTVEIFPSIEKFFQLLMGLDKAGRTQRKNSTLLF